MEIKLNFPMLGRMFMMPASVADEYIKISTGEQIKVLLCIYCLGAAVIKTEEIAAMSGVDEQTVREAVIHFSKLGVFSAEGVTGAQPQAQAQPAVNTSPKAVDELKLIGGAEPIRGTLRDTSRDARVRYTPKEIAAKIEADPALKALCDEMEGILAASLKPAHLGDILEMYEHLELDPASIQMIAEYCKSIGKCKTAYILTVAREWFDEGICGFDMIERKIIGMTAYNSLEGRIRRLIGQEGNATKKQRDFIRSWQDMGFDYEMIKLAYEANIDSKGKLSFPYMNKILISWNEKGIHLPVQVQQEKERYQADKQPVAAGGISASEVEAFADSIDLSKLSN